MAPFRVKFHALVVHGIVRNEEETAFAKHLNTEMGQNPHQQNVTLLKTDAPRMVRSESDCSNGVASKNGTWFQLP